jgi:hypothetical protein
VKSGVVDRGSRYQKSDEASAHACVLGGGKVQEGRWGVVKSYKSLVVKTHEARQQTPAATK